MNGLEVVLGRLREYAPKIGCPHDFASSR